MSANSIKKYISVTLIILILSYTILGLFSFGSNTSYAATGFSTDISGINEKSYPGYKALIQNLQKKYPKWNFKLYYTGLKWNEVIIRESQGHGTKSPKSLFQYGSTYKGDWYCPVCGTREYDNGSWRCASEPAIKYMMDPRASINESDVFQFQDIGYDSSIDSADIKTMVSGTFLDKTELITAILNAGKDKKINPLFISARILQEQGTTGSVLSAGNGYNGQYKGYYNYFNIGATGDSTAEVITNGLKHAQSKGWNTPELSIKGGISLLADNYVADGQNTCYFQKFNVIDKSNLYNNQYMQSIMAAQFEGAKLRSAYADINKLNGDYTFIIPVYEGMPTATSSRPNANATYTQKTYDIAKLNVTSTLTLRASPNGTFIEDISKGTTVKILERATSKVGGIYWDKVVITNNVYNGYSGYMARGER